MENTKDLRKILSQNIKKTRGILHISQAKLAEYADISLSYLTDIERCRTWVSDKTLQNLAKALNREVWELFLMSGENDEFLKERESLKKQRDKMRRIAEIIIQKKEILRHTSDQVMEDLIMEIVQEDAS